MTTVAYRDGVMAADRRCSIHNAEVTKITRGKDGCLYGVAGNLAKCRFVVDWLENDEVDPPVFVDNDDDWHVLVVEKESGKLFLYDRGFYPLEIEGEFFAIGSGSPYAMGAMACECSAKEAVVVAAVFDSNTGPEVEELTL